MRSPPARAGVDRPHQQGLLRTRRAGSFPRRHFRLSSNCYLDLALALPRQLLLAGKRLSVSRQVRRRKRRQRRQRCPFRRLKPATVSGETNGQDEQGRDHEPAAFRGAPVAHGAGFAAAGARLLRRPGPDHAGAQPGRRADARSTGGASRRAAADHHQDDQQAAGAGFSRQESVRPRCAPGAYLPDRTGARHHPRHRKIGAQDGEAGPERSGQERPEGAVETSRARRGKPFQWHTSSMRRSTTGSGRTGRLHKREPAIAAGRVWRLRRCAIQSKGGYRHETVPRLWPNLLP